MRASTRKIAKAVFCLAATKMAACGPASRLDRTQQVSVQGVVRRADGAALQGARVGMVRIPDLFEALTTGLVVVSSLGVVCLSPNAPPICATFRSTTTGSSGAWGFSLTGADTQGSLGQAVPFLADVSGAAPAGTASGPVVSARFVINAARVQVPDLRLWQPTQQIRLGVDGWIREWSSLESDVGVSPRSYGVQVMTSGGIVIATLGPMVGTSVTVDPRLLEDFVGSWWVEGTRQVASDGTSFDLTYRSPGLALPSGGRAAASRGRACIVERNGSSEPLATGTSCPLTDGDLRTAYAPATCPGGTCPRPSARWVAVDLGAPATVARVYVRGYSGAAALVEGSLEGSVWQTYGAVPSPTGAGSAAVVPPAGALARFVRLRSSNSAQALGSIAELSVF